MAKDGSSEINAVGAVHKALQGLDATVQGRVLRYVAEMLSISLQTNVAVDPTPALDEEEPTKRTPLASGAVDDQSPDDTEGISPVAMKWIRRSDLNLKALQTLFSLGVEDIDLVAKEVPGPNKKERMKSVLLLKGIAAYLGTGAARVTYEQLKEACLHYKAYDPANFAAYLKSFAPEVGGSKDAGFVLTPRGLNEATDVVKGMLAPKA